MTPDETIIAARREIMEPGTAVDAAEQTEEDEAEEAASEDFNPLGHIEGWSAFECSSGPFGHRG